jgi:hypothetical protein
MPQKVLKWHLKNTTDKKQDPNITNEGVLLYQVRMKTILQKCAC